MTKDQKIALGAGVIILLLLLWYYWKTTQATSYVGAGTVAPTPPTTISTVSSAAIFDFTTGLEIGYNGVRNDPSTIGPVITPANVTNSIHDPNFLNYLESGITQTPLCPLGSRPLIDPGDGDVYCTLNGQGGNATHVSGNTTATYQVPASAVGS